MSSRAALIVFMCLAMIALYGYEVDAFFKTGKRDNIRKLEKNSNQNMIHNDLPIQSLRTTVKAKVRVTSNLN